MKGVSLGFLCAMGVALAGGFVSQKAGVESSTPAIVLAVVVWIVLSVLVERRT